MSDAWLGPQDYSVSAGSVLAGDACGGVGWGHSVPGLPAKETPSLLSVTNATYENTQSGFYNICVSLKEVRREQESEVS